MHWYDDCREKMNMCTIKPIEIAHFRTQRTFGDRNCSASIKYNYCRLKVAQHSSFAPKSFLLSCHSSVKCIKSFFGVKLVSNIIISDRRRRSIHKPRDWTFTASKNRKFHISSTHLPPCLRGRETGYENTNLDEEELYWPFLYALESRFTRSAIRFFSNPDLTVQNGCALVIFLQHGLADCQMRVDSRFQDTTSIFAVRIFLTKCAWNQGQKKAKIVCAIDLPWTYDSDRARYKMYYTSPKQTKRQNYPYLDLLWTFSRIFQTCRLNLCSIVRYYCKPRSLCDIFHNKEYCSTFLLYKASSLNTLLHNNLGQSSASK